MRTCRPEPSHQVCRSCCTDDLRRGIPEKKATQRATLRNLGNENKGHRIWIVDSAGENEIAGDRWCEESVNVGRLLGGEEDKTRRRRMDSAFYSVKDLQPIVELEALDTRRRGPYRDVFECFVRWKDLWRRLSYSQVNGGHCPSYPHRQTGTRATSSTDSCFFCRWNEASR